MIIIIVRIIIYESHNQLTDRRLLPARSLARCSAWLAACCYLHLFVESARLMRACWARLSAHAHTCRPLSFSEWRRRRRRL